MNAGILAWQLWVCQPWSSFGTGSRRRVPENKYRNCLDPLSCTVMTVSSKVLYSKWRPWQLLIPLADYQISPLSVFPFNFSCEDTASNLTAVMTFMKRSEVKLCRMSLMTLSLHVTFWLMQFWITILCIFLWYFPNRWSHLYIKCHWSRWW